MSTHSNPFDVLVDPRSGVISDIRRVAMPTNLPAALVMYDSILSDARQWGQWEVDSTGGGCSLGDEAAARGAALGEAVERYCGNLIPPNLLRGSANQIADQGHTPLSLQDVALYSAEQYASTGFPFSELSDDLELEWVAGENMADGTTVMVPAPLVWVSYIGATTQRGLRHVCPIMHAGLSAGPDLEFATTSALTEIIERDAMTMAWHGRRDLQWVTPDSDVAAIARGRTGQLDTKFIVLPDDSGCVVIGAIVRDRGTGYLTMGTSARTTARPAMMKALAEACQLQRFVADFDDRDGPYMRVAADPRSPLMPWRADRRYLDDYIPGGLIGDATVYGRVRDYACHLQMYLDPRMQDAFAIELESACTDTVDASELAGDADMNIDNSEALARRLIDTGSTVVRVDVTTPDIADTGMRVVRMLATGRYSNSPVGLPFLGGSRLDNQLHDSGRTRRCIPLPH